VDHFRDIVDAFVAAGAVVQLRSPGELCGELRRLLADAGERERLGARGREVLLAGRGVAARYSMTLAGMLGGRGSSTGSPTRRSA
jgi:hypothetical protein